MERYKFTIKFKIIVLFSGKRCLYGVSFFFFKIIHISFVKIYTVTEQNYLKQYTKTLPVKQKPVSYLGIGDKDWLYCTTEYRMNYPV